MLALLKLHWKICLMGILILLILGFLVYERVTPGGFLSEPQNDLKSIIPTESASYTDLEGNPVDFGQFNGKPIVVNAWATWMPFSQTELPLLIQAQERYGSAVTILAINRMEDRERVKAYLTTFGIPTDKIVFLVDPTDHFYKSVGGYAMPETVYLRKDGVIETHTRGTLTESDLNQNIDALVAS